MADEQAPARLTAESARAVQFREKLRGYHPDDVDDFVATVASTLEAADARIAALEARVAELETQIAEGPDSDDALRRTLVLAQRTADLAMQEAREEAARLLAEATTEHANVMTESASLRERMVEEAAEEARPIRERLFAERTALQADVDAIDAYLANERERLRIYFTDQLRRLEEGYPGLRQPPDMSGPAAPASSAVPPDAGGAGEHEVEPRLDDDVPRPAGDLDDGDAFLAELRRAVNDEAPLGPREDDGPTAGEEGGDEFDMFAPEEDDGGRFGGLRRRRR